MKKNQTVTIKETFKTASTTFKQGERFIVYMEATTKANALLLRIGKRGKPLDVWNVKNVSPLSAKNSAQALAAGYIEIN